MDFRLQLDVPIALAVEPGYARAVHCADFQPEGLDDAETLDYNGCWREPKTGLVLLRPSFLTRNFYADFKDIGHWDFNSDFWLPSARATDNGGNSASMMTSVTPADQPHGLIQRLYDIAIIAILAETSIDTLLWALQSSFTLAADEAMCIHYHGLADEMLRYHNWFAVQFDNIGVYISQTGTCRVYKYNRDDLTETPVMVDKFDFASPGDLIGSHGHFYLQPIPEYGLLFHHSRRTPSNNVMSSNSDTRAASGHLIPWPTHTYGDKPTLFEPSKVTIGVNPHMPHLLGYQSVTFTTGGVFTDGIFDPGYPPSDVPAAVTASKVPARQTTVTAALNIPNNSRAWAVGDRQGRVQLTLTTTDSKYTPFVNGYYVGWTPTQTMRDTEALIPTRMLHLEFTEDEMTRFEGRAELLLMTAAERRIAERGDTTWVIEKSADGGETWETMTGGIARVEEAEAVIDQAGFYYRATLTLSDMHERLREVHAMHANAFDGQPLPEAFDGALISAGFPALLSYPTEFAPIKLPITSQGQQWRLAARENDDGDTLTDMFLLYGRGQSVEYQLVFDWAAFGWKIVRKPRDITDEGTWTLTSDSAEHDPDNRIVRWESLTLRPEPPEANLISVIGVTSLDGDDKAQVQSPPIFNFASLNDPDSDDYLGRIKPFAYKALGLSDQGQVNIMARRITEAISHRRLKSDAGLPDYIEALVPNIRVKVRAPGADGTMGTIFTAWVKRRTVVLPQEGPTSMTLELDTVWEGELSK